MGNSSSTQVDTLINQEVYNELESLMKTSGSSSSSNQTTNLSGVKLVVIGGDKCKEHPVVSIKNENQISLDNILSTSAKTFAETVAKLSALIKNDVEKGGFSIGGNTIVNTTDISTIENAIKTELESKCGDANVNQSINVKDSLFDLTCASLDINNKNVKNIACVMDTISDVTSKLDGTVETEASTTVKNGSNTTMYMIIGIIVLIIIVALIFYFSPVTGIIILILVIVIVVGIGIYYFNQ